MAQRKSPSRSRKDQKKPGAGCLLWLALLLVTLFLFVFNWERIQDTLETTRFVEALGERGRSAQGTQDTKQTDNKKPAPPTAPAAGTNPITVEPAATGTNGKPPAAAPAGTQPAPQAVAGQGERTPAAAAQPGPAPGPVELVSKTRVVSLFFVRVDADGMVTRHEVKRTVGSSDSPLTDALNALLEGPSTEELNRSLISLVPSGTKLLSAQVRGSTAYLNFNDAFMINPYAIEGYAAQLKQIVYTATSFSTVKDVQFLIEGEKREYLGGEGVYIGKPLSRGSF